MRTALSWLDPQAPREGASSNRLIAAARIVLPLAVAVIILVSVLWAQGTTPVKPRDIEKQDMLNTLEAPRYNSIDKDGNPYVVEAQSVSQQDANSLTATLVAPKAYLALDGKGSLDLSARAGVYQHEAQKLDLNGGVALKNDDKMTIITDHIRVDLGGRTATSDTPVSAKTNKGDTLKAQGGIDIKDGGAIIIFKGPAQLNMNGQDTTTQGQ